MHQVAHIDFETRSRVNLKKSGTAAYAEDPSTEVLCLCYAFDDEPVRRWARGAPIPADLMDHVRAGGLCVGHNVYFELYIWNMLHKRAPHVWPPLSVSQCRCTMIGARMLALPGGLDKAGEIMKISEQKDKAGHRLMLKLCKPNKSGQWVGDDGDFKALVDYCAKDVEAERHLDKMLPVLPLQERELWELDWKINSRGICVDIQAVDRLIELVEAEASRLKLRTAQITGGRVTSPSKVAQMLAFLESEGVSLDNLRKDTVARLLKGVVDNDTAKELLTIRRQFAKASTAKLKAMRAGVCSDNRLRDLLAFLGADTWRWAGRRVQTQNLPRLPKHFDIATGFSWLYREDAAALFAGWEGSVLDVVSWMLRPLLIAAHGKVLMGGDFANIEGRVAAWAAGEEWKLQAFRDYDAGIGPDLYKVSYGRSFNVDPAEIGDDDPRRQKGKVGELSLQYQGALGAYQAMGVNYGITVVPFRTAENDSDETLTEDEVREIVRGWRSAHPATVNMWYRLEDAGINAVRFPGKIFEAGPVQFRCTGDFLRMRLPSGRSLVYSFPRVHYGPNKFGKVCWQLFSWGVDGRKGKKVWAERQLYGGHLFENLCQAIARDLMAYAQPRLEAAGYPIVMHVHDEIVCELDEGRGDKNEFRQLMCELPAWAKGLPVTIGKPWQGQRYCK